MKHEEKKHTVDVPAGGAVDDIGRLLQMAGPRPLVPADMAERVHDAVQAEWRERVKSRRRLKWVARSVVGLAAAAAVVAGVFVAVRMSVPKLPIAEGEIAVLDLVDGSVYEMTKKRKRYERGRHLVVGDAVVGGAMIETSAASRAAFTLGDGASMRLDFGTRVRMINPELLILDRGRVYLDSGASEASGPGVEIRTPFGPVREIGTQFDTAVTQTELRIRVREGRVDVATDEGVLEADAGSQLTVEADGTVRRSALPPWGADWGWVLSAAPQFDLDGSTLAQYLSWVRRETGLEILFADPSIESDAPGIELHGTLRTLRPEQSLDAVLPTCGLDYRAEPGRVIIMRLAA